MRARESKLAEAVVTHGLPVEELAECDDCDWTGPISECNNISHYNERVDVGGVDPLGECPECGALAYWAAGDHTWSAP